MRFLRLAWIGTVGLIVLALLPVSAATAPVHGVVTTCSSTTSCKFVFNTSLGTGWATTAGTRISFQLPGEAKASYNLSYTAYIAKLTGTYTYWTVGNFHGTDVNTGKVVVGTTNTNYTITAHCSRGCSYTYTTDNGTIVFRFTQAELTSISVSCTPSSLSHSNKTSCTAKVTNLGNSSNTPTGRVHFSSFGYGSFTNKANCNLTAGQCSLTWRPFDETTGTVSISATFVGTKAFYTSTTSTSVSVTGGGG
jgi:hypothetical protein